MDPGLAISTYGLSRTFHGVQAVAGVDLEVRRGSFYGFLGPNGAGKSTTIKMLTGLLVPSSGEISVLGFDPRIPREALEMKRRIGVVPEDLALFDNLTAREYLWFVGRMHEIERTALAGRIDELLHLMSLSGEEAKLTVEFSHGMKKKLAMAAALLPNPDLMFLDEPFEGVDAVASRTIRKTLEAFVQRGSTVFLTSHVLEIVERLCTHVGIIVNGRLVEQTSLAELGDVRAEGGAALTLEERFMQVVGAGHEATSELSWLGGEGRE